MLTRDMNLADKLTNVFYNAGEVNDSTKGEGNMKDEQRELIEKVFFPLWDMWTEDRLSEDVNEVMRYFAQQYGCTEKSPLSLMFAAFCGGVDMGIELDRKMIGD